MIVTSASEGHSRTYCFYRNKIEYYGTELYVNIYCMIKKNDRFREHKTSHFIVSAFFHLKVCELAYAVRNNENPLLLYS